MSEVYQAPAAALNVGGSGDLNEFERFSMWGFIGLSIVTLGAYYMYWMYARSERLNGVHENKISKALMVLTMVSYIGYLASSFIPEAQFAGNDMLLVAVLGMMLGYLVLYVVWVFTFRSRMLDMAWNNGNADFKVNPVLTFLFGPLYFQYKINRYVDDKPIQA